MDARVRICAGCALKAYGIQSPEMETAAKPSSQPDLQSKHPGNSQRVIFVQWHTFIEMYSSINADMPEVNALVERFRRRTDLLPLKARRLKRLTAELKAISEVGLPWKAVWRILRDHKPQSS